MQIERLVQMIFYITNHEHVTARELSDYFGVSTRTIYRDINTLTIAGIPIVSTKGTGGGISLIEGYTIDKSVLSKEEQQNIYHGLQILKSTKYPSAEATLSKIGAVFRSALEPNWLEVDFTYWGSDETEKIKLSELKHAILSKHIITFSYFSSELNATNRVVEPLQLLFKSHAWYIVGYCRDKHEIRNFRMSRIRNLNVMPETFKRELPSDYSLEPKCEEECNIPFLALKFSPKIAHKVYDEFKEHQVSTAEDGSYIVKVQYELNNWTFNYLLSFGKYVEIIEPKAARDMLKKRALEIAEIYN